MKSKKSEKPYYLYRRGNTWYYRLRGWKTFKTTLETDREEAVQYVLWKMGRLGCDDGSKQTLGDIAHNFYTEENPRTAYKLSNGTLHERTMKRFQGTINKHIMKSPLVDKQLRDINVHDRDEYLDCLIKQKREGLISGYTLDNIIKRLITILKWAVYKGWMVNNPFEGHEKTAKSSQVGKCIEAQYLSQLLISFDPDKPIESQTGPFKSFERRLIFLVGMLTGMRRGELLALRWQDFNLELNKVTISHAVKDESKYSPLGTPKSNKSRVTPFPEFLTEQLKAYKAAYPRIYQDDKDYVFIANDGERHSFSWYRASWSYALRKCGFVDKNGKNLFRAHDLRHTACTNMLSSGAPADMVRKALGHGNQAMTEHYTHFSEKNIMKALECYQEQMEAFK